MAGWRGLSDHRRSRRSWAGLCRGDRAACRGPVVVLTGRSELDEVKRARLSAIEALGSRVEYRRVDVSDAAAVSSLIASLRETYGCVSGIIHAAGVIRDSFLLKKTVEEASSVLAPKVRGIVNLDDATRDLALEFMILFGSGSGGSAMSGQSDYAAGNAFLGSYAAYRNALVSRASGGAGRCRSPGRCGATAGCRWTRPRGNGSRRPVCCRLRRRAGCRRSTRLLPRAMKRSWCCPVNCPGCAPPCCDRLPPKGVSSQT